MLQFFINLFFSLLAEWKVIRFIFIFIYFFITDTLYLKIVSNSDDASIVEYISAKKQNE